MPQRDKLVKVFGEIFSSSTDLSWRFSDGDVEVWLPKSQCEWDEEEGMMTMPEWLAMEKGLI